MVKTMILRGKEKNEKVWKTLKPNLDLQEEKLW